jgi:hypothetical protein
MAFDFNAIASAIATRFSSANVTAPSSETNVRASTSALPQAISVEPTVLVYPPEITLAYTAGTRHGVAEFPVRFYLQQIRDNGRNATLVNKWLGSLYAQLEGQVHLGLSGYVAQAVVSAITPGDLTYGGITYLGLEFTVTVSLWEGLSPTA